jgi:hypothetical protein
MCPGMFNGFRSSFGMVLLVVCVPVVSILVVMNNPDVVFHWCHTNYSGPRRKNHFDHIDCHLVSTFPSYWSDAYTNTHRSELSEVSVDWMDSDGCEAFEMGALVGRFNSEFRLPNSESGLQTPDVRRQTPDVKRQTPDARRQTPAFTRQPSHVRTIRCETSTSKQ